jgi:hypothetical protein
MRLRWHSHDNPASHAGQTSKKRFLKKARKNFYSWGLWTFCAD